MSAKTTNLATAVTNRYRGDGEERSEELSHWIVTIKIKTCSECACSVKRRGGGGSGAGG